MTDPDFADMLLAARKAHRWLGDEDAPRSLEEAIANLQDITGLHPGNAARARGFAAPA